jgi:hypothetical protein
MNSIPLACDMNVFTPAEREQHIQTTRELFAEVQNIRDVEHGYEFSLPNGTNSILKLAEFILNERKCCPFLVFTLKIPPENNTIALTLTGPEGTPEFLREEFSEAFA